MPLLRLAFISVTCAAFSFVSIMRTEAQETEAAMHLLKSGAKFKVIELEYSGGTIGFSAVHALSPSLLRVTLSSIKIKKDHICELTKLQKLESVRLFDTCVRADWFEALSKVKGLQDLQVVLAMWNTSDSDLKEVRLVKSLRALSVNSVTGVGDEWLIALKDLPKLQRLDVGRMAITDKGVELISKCKTIENLELYSTEITDKCFAYLESMPKLKHVDISNTKITRTALKAFQKKRPDITIDATSER